MLGTNKQQKAWVVFDWANSAYSLVIVSTIFPEVFNSFADKSPVFLGINFHSAEALYTYSICFSFFLVAIFTPLLSGIADYSGRKKQFMQWFTRLGAFSCMALYFFAPERIWIGVVGAILASVGYSGSMVFYNAFLPEIASRDEQDKLSAVGYSFGYIGSSLLLIALLVLVAFYTELGFSTEIEVFKMGFVVVGLWWLGWSQWTFNGLPNPSKKMIVTQDKLKKGFEELKEVWQNLRHSEVLRKFLLAFFMVDLGLQTLIIVAPLFALNVIGMQGMELIVVVLIMQFLGVIGATVFSKLTAVKGSIWSLMAASLVYLLICFLAFSYQDKMLFYGLAGLMGFALGGMQSQARSAYAKLLPGIERTASYFSFYDVLEKTAIVLGTFIYGGIAYFFSDSKLVEAPRLGILILGVFFTAGLLLWLPLRKVPNLK